MNEREIIRKWDQDDKVVVIGDELRQTLVFLAMQGFKSVLVKYLGGDNWGIAKIY